MILLPPGELFQGSAGEAREQFDILSDMVPGAGWRCDRTSLLVISAKPAWISDTFAADAVLAIMLEPDQRSPFCAPRAVEVGR